MSDTKVQGNALNLSENHRSDGTELIPAEVQANVRHSAPQSTDPQSTDSPLVYGTTIDDEGLLNNYAIEPEIYPSDYPSLRQQTRYAVMGVGAMLLVVILVLIAFTAS